MPKIAIFIFLAALFLPGLSLASTIVESSYRVGDDEFRLRASLRWVTSDRFGPNTIAMNYSVYRNDKFLHPADLGGGTLMGGTRGRATPIEEQVSIEVIENVGWQVNMGAIRGNTSSDDFTFILPRRAVSKWNYLQHSFTAKYAPIIRRNGDTIEIWSCYQEWGGGATVFSFFVPELRTISFDRGQPRIAKASLPSDLAIWPELEYVGTLGKFIAGLSQLNPDLMAAVNEQFDAGHMESLNYHKLPPTVKDRQQLIENIRQVATLRQQYERFELHWGNLD